MGTIPRCDFNCSGKYSLPLSLNSSADQLLSTCLVCSSGDRVSPFYSNLKVKATLETCMHTCTFLYIFYIHTCTHVYTHKYIYTHLCIHQTKLMCFCYAGNPVLRNCLVWAGKCLHLSPYFSPRLSAIHSREAP